MHSHQENKHKVFLTVLLLVVSMSSLVLASNNCATLKEPAARNQDFQIWQTCNNCSFCNFTFFNLSAQDGVEYEASTNNNWRYFVDLNGTNFTELGMYRYDYLCGNSIETTTGCVNIQITSTGDYFDQSQSIVVIAQLGAIILLLAMGFSFKKEQWKLKTFFYICSLLMGVILLNSVNMITGVSNGLYYMGQAGVWLIITIVSFMIAWFFIMMTLELFGYFKKKKKDAWRMREYE